MSIRYFFLVDCFACLVATDRDYTAFVVLKIGHIGAVVALDIGTAVLDAEVEVLTIACRIVIKAHVVGQFLDGVIVFCGRRKLFNELIYACSVIVSNEHSHTITTSNINSVVCQNFQKFLVVCYYLFHIY